MKTLKPNSTLQANRNYRISSKEILDLTDEFQIIGGFITLKKKEKAIKEIVDTNKPTFIKACDIVADGQNQITFKYEGEDVLLYTSERKKYAYSDAIVKAEEKLKAIKAAFEKKNEPVEVTRCWAVKL